MKFKNTIFQAAKRSFFSIFDKFSNSYVLDYSFYIHILTPVKLEVSKDIKIVYFRGSDDYAPPPKKN